MKHIILGSAAIAALAGSVSAEALPVAVGKDGWSLTRGEQVIAQKPLVLTSLEAGDVVASEKAAVRVTSPDTASEVLVSPESSIAFDNAGTWRLIDGGAAVSTKQNGVVAFDGLNVAPIKGSAKADESTMYVVRRMDEKTITVQGFENRVAVVDTAAATQLAVVGPGDRMVFVRDGSTWKSTLSTAGQAGIFRAQTGNEDDTAAADEDKKTDRRKAALLIGGVAGAAAIAGGTYYVVDSQDNNDSDDNQQNKTSTKPR